MLGLSQSAIRSWEDRYGVIVAERSEGGRRVYTRDHLEQLRFVKGRLDEGLSAADAHRLLAERQADAPLIAEAPLIADAPPVTEEEPSSPPSRVLVLVAESDRYGAELNDYLLRAEGYEVEVALSAEEAEAKFASHAPALSIVELMISGGIGRELCQRLKTRRATPVLCVSSLDLGEHALAAGADAFLKKPLEPLQLVSTVKDLLQRSGIRREELGAT